jgi:hypothetical protein
MDVVVEKKSKYNKAVYDRDCEYYKEYMREYSRKKYQNDPAYRSKIIAKNRNTYTRKTTNCDYCKRRVAKDTVEDLKDIKCNYCQKYGIPKENDEE